MDTRLLKDYHQAKRRARLSHKQQLRLDWWHLLKEEVGDLVLTVVAAGIFGALLGYTVHYMWTLRVGG